MNTRLRISLFCVALLAAACAALPTGDIEVETEYDPDAGFAAYRTFSWQQSSTRVHDPQGLWQPVDMDIDAELHRLINTELGDRGMAEADNGADLVVAYAAGVDMTTLDLVENPQKQLRILQHVPIAALVVILVDTATGYPVWVGKATGNLTSDTTERTKRKRIEYAIHEMFRRLPGR